MNLCFCSLNLQATIGIFKTAKQANSQDENLNKENVYPKKVIISKKAKQYATTILKASLLPC